MAIAVNKLCITDVARALFRAEADATRSPEAVCHHSHIARVRVEPVDLVWQLGRRPHALVVAVHGVGEVHAPVRMDGDVLDRKSTRLNSSHMSISYAVFCLKKKKLSLYSSHVCTPWRLSIISTRM